MLKCGVVLQGHEWPDIKVPIAGFKVCRKVKDLGKWLENASVMEQFHGPSAKLQAKAQFSATLPLRENEKV